MKNAGMSHKNQNSAFNKRANIDVKGNFAIYTDGKNTGKDATNSSATSMTKEYSKSASCMGEGYRGSKRSKSY